MANAPTPEELSLKLRDLTRAGLEFHSALAEVTRMAPQDMAALTHLASEGPLTPTQLGDRLRLRHSSVTKLIERLIERGRVERIPNPEDRRSVLIVYRADRVPEELRWVLPLHGDIMREAARFTAEERAAVARFLDVAAGEYRRHIEKAPRRDGLAPPD